MPRKPNLIGDVGRCARASRDVPWLTCLPEPPELNGMAAI
jgi:hypothetical protein